MDDKEEIFTVSTPFPGVETATLYQNVWQEHIESRHPEMIGQQKAVAKTLQAPTFVCAGDDVGKYGFISHTEVSDSGQPSVVFVDTNTDDGKPLVTTAFKGRKSKFLDKSKFEVLWP